MESEIGICDLGPTLDDNLQRRHIAIYTLIHFWILWKALSAQLPLPQCPWILYNTLELLLSWSKQLVWTDYVLNSIWSQKDLKYQFGLPSLLSLFSFSTLSFSFYPLFAFWLASVRFIQTRPSFRTPLWAYDQGGSQDHWPKQFDVNSSLSGHRMSDKTVSWTHVSPTVVIQ